MGEEFGKSAESWVYRYNQRNPTQNASFGVAHAAENWMMFKGTNTKYAYFLSNVLFQSIQHPYASFNGSHTFTQMTPTEDAFAAELIAYWLSFVRSGDPNQYRLSRSPEWPMYKCTSRIVLQQGLDTISGSFIEAEPETDKTRCALVGSQVEQLQN
jgi:carboxylesterase type B